MTREEHIFLCGLLSCEKPQKTVEIGVAAGATTAVIMNCLQSLKCKGAMYSVDVAEKYYRDKSKITGFWYEDNFAVNENDEYKHKLFLGTTIADRIEGIGDEIDFCVIDTAHSLPGELLDFLTILPYLKHDATVVFHDVDLSHELPKRWNKKYNARFFAIATRLLFSMLNGEKYYNPAKAPNIAAVKLTADTSKCINDIFLMLNTKWKYFPEEWQLQEYRNLYAKCYDEFCLSMFDEAEKYNRVFFTHFPYDKVRENSKIIIYGYGEHGKTLVKELIASSYCQISAICDKRSNELTTQNVNVIGLTELAAMNVDEYDNIVISVVDNKIAGEIANELISLGIPEEKIV